MGKLLNRTRMGVSGTPGTGTITLGSAVPGYQTFAAAGANDQDVLTYVAEDGSAWEYGTGTYTASGTTLSRTLGNSSTGSLLSLSSGAQVFVSPLAADLSFRIGSVVDFSVTPAATVDFTLPSSVSLFAIEMAGVTCADSIIARFSMDGTTFVTSSSYTSIDADMNSSAAGSGGYGTSTYGSLTVSGASNTTIPSGFSGIVNPARSGFFAPSIVGEATSADGSYVHITSIGFWLVGQSAGAKKLRVQSGTGTNNITKGILSLRAIA